MASPSSTPRYARATISSTSRGISKSPKSNESRKGLKRPSTLSSPAPDLLIIKPDNPKKPCLIATLPTELRLLIYENALPEGLIRPDYSQYNREMQTRPFSPNLLRICRRIHNETLQVFYTTASFITSITSLGPCSNHSWADKVSPLIRTFLARNKNMTVSVLDTARFNRIAPWKDTRRFGNVYTVHEGHRIHFLRFCRLATWWLACAENAVDAIKWEFDFVESEASRGWFGNYRMSDYREEQLRGWLFQDMTAMTLPCVQEAWVRERRERKMKEPALRMLDGLDRNYKDLYLPVRGWGSGAETLKSIQTERSQKDDEWSKRVELLRRFVEKW